MRLGAPVFLDRPHIAVKNVEEAEPRSWRTLRAHLLDLADAHAAPGELATQRVEILDNQLDALD